MNKGETRIELVRKLDAFIRKYYRNELLRGLILAITVSLVFFLGFTIAEYFGRFNHTWRSMLFWGYLLLVIVIIGRWVVVPVMHLFRIGKVISHEEAARIIGRHFSEVRDVLLNTLQLQRMADELPGSQELLLAGISQKTEQLRPVPFLLAISVRASLRFLRYLALPLLLIALILIASPGIITRPTKRIVHYSHVFPLDFPFRLSVLNNELRGIQQEDFVIRIGVEGEELPAGVSIMLGDGSLYQARSETRTLFTHTFRKLRKDFSFRLVAGDYISDPYTVTVVPKPVVLGFTLHFDYPSYIGRGDENIENTGDFTVPAGTRVTWQLLTRDAESVIFRFGSFTDTLDAAMNRVSFTHRFMEGTDYSIRTSNAYLAGPDSLLFSARVIPDSWPGISVSEYRDSIDDRRLYFMGTIRDDYGFRKLEFRYRLMSDSASDIPFGIAGIAIDPGRTQQVFYHHLDLAELGIRAGESYEYYFEVWDNDAVNGSKSTRSDRYIYRAPGKEEIDKIGRQQSEAIQNSLENSILNARNLQKDIDEFYRKVADKKELGWQDKKQLELLLQRQQELKARVKETLRKEEQKARFEEQFREPDPAFMAKQQELQRLMEELLDKDLLDLLKQIEDMMDKVDKNTINDMLDKMKLGAEDLENSLDRNLELFRQLEFEKKFDEAIGELEELAGEQKKLADESEGKNADTESLKEKQDALGKRFSEFRQNLMEARDLNKALEEPNRMGETSEEEQEIGNQMKEGSEMLEKGQGRKASQPMNNASGQMEQLAAQLRKMQESMAMEQMGEDILAVREMLENLVEVSFSQERLMNEVMGLPVNDPRYIRLVQEQKRIHDDLGMIQDSLEALSRRQIMIQPFVNKEISQIRLNSQRTIEALTDNRGREVRNNSYLSEAVRRQQYVMTSVNNLALLLDESLQQMQMQMNQMKSAGSKACNNPKKSGAGKKSVKSIRQLQESLNKELEALRKGMEQGKQKQGGQTLSEQLARLAAEQEAVRRQMQDYINSLGKEGMGEKGELNKLLEQMEQTETELVNKSLSNATLLRQQEILTRLLESEKAEQERELDEQRESTESKNSDISNPERFFEYKGLKPKDTELLYTVPPTLRQYYKQKVNAYLFNN